jgi:hypothetical protein
MTAEIDREIPAASVRGPIGFARRPRRPTAGVVAVKAYNPGFDYAKRLIHEGKAVRDDRDAWSEHQPSAAQENAFIEEHSIEAYGRWHLAVDDELNPTTKGHYKFPYGDFVNVHRCAVLSAESRAGQRKYTDVELAAAHLHGMIDS